MASEIINQNDIVEKVFLDLHYQIVPESEAVFVRIRLKSGRSLTGIVSEDSKPVPARVVLSKELQHASQ